MPLINPKILDVRIILDIVIKRKDNNKYIKNIFEAIPRLEKFLWKKVGTKEKTKNEYIYTPTHP
tara:strand:- start:70 stop:261 length:192 start_codon:yes stop_codon:yes gene_type:complete